MKSEITISSFPYTLKESKDETSASDGTQYIIIISSVGVIILAVLSLLAIILLTFYCKFIAFSFPHN